MGKHGQLAHATDKLAVKGQTPSGATRTNNTRQGLETLLVAVVCLHALNYTHVSGWRSSVENNVSHSLHTLTFLTRLNIAACDSARLLGGASVIVLRYNSERL